MAKQPKPRKPKDRKKKRTVKSFEQTAAAQAFRLGLKYTCWVSLQVPECDTELTAYVDFKRMRCLPWNHRAYTVRQAMNAIPYQWSTWWVLRMNTGTGPFYKDYEIPQPVPRKLKDLLGPIAAAGQQITEQQRLEHIEGRGAIFVPNGYQFSEAEIDQIFTLVRKHGTPVDEIRPAS